MYVYSSRVLLSLIALATALTGPLNARIGQDALEQLRHQRAKRESILSGNSSVSDESMILHLRVAVEEWVPHVKVDETSDGQIIIRGPMANLLDSLAKSLNFKYTLVRPPDGAWGIPDDNGRWNGMIGMVKRDEADLALGPFGLTFSRSRVVEFSSPILIDYYRILVKRPQLETDTWRFTSPFRHEVWFGLVGCIFVITSLLTFIWFMVGKEIARINKDQHIRGSRSKHEPVNFGGHLLSVFGATFSQPFTWDIKPSSGRIVVAIWWLTVVVMAKSYSSSLTSLLAVRTINPKYEYLTDLVEDEKVNLIFEKATALVEHFSNVEKGIYKDLADTADEGRANFLASSLLYDAAYTEVKYGPYALLVEDTTCRKVYSDDFTKFGKCNFYLGKERYWPLIFCIIGKKGHPLMKDVNTRLDRILSHDLYFKWLSDEVPNATACLKASKTVTVKEPYSLLSLWGVFTVFGLCLFVAVCVLLLELIYTKTKNKISILG